MDEVKSDAMLNPFDPANDFFKDLESYQPELQKDEPDFRPIKGRYVCRIAKLQHNTGVSTTTNEPYDFYSMDLQIVETIEGDKGDKRYLKKRYGNTPEGLKKLWNDLFTAGIEFNKTSREDFDLSLPNTIDKTLKIRAWSWTPEKDRAGNILPEEDRTPLQSFVIVNDFAKGGKKKTTERPPF